MPSYQFHYRQTEYRKIEVHGTDLQDAITQYLNGNGCDAFVGTDDDQYVIAIHQHKNYKGAIPTAIWEDGDGFDGFDDSQSAARTIYAALRAAQAYERPSVRA